MPVAASLDPRRRLVSAAVAVFAAVTLVPAYAYLAQHRLMFLPQPPAPDRIPGGTGADAGAVVAIGSGPGSGVGIHLAAERPLAAVVPVTPFDSVTAVAQSPYPFVPVGLRLRHPFDSLSRAGAGRVPPLTTAAGRDGVIPPRRAARLHGGWAGPKRLRAFADADHVGVVAHPRAGPRARLSWLRGARLEPLLYWHFMREPALATIELTKHNFEQVINGNDQVVIDFWAPWCAPCRAFAPTFEAASERHADVVFAKVNTEEEQELSAAFNIRSIPTLMIFREQVILYAEAGALPAPALDEVLDKAKAIDMAAVHREIAASQEAAPGA